MPSDVIIRAATQADAVAFYGGLPKCSFRGYVAADHEAIVAIGGVYRDGSRWVAFSELRPGMRGHRKALAKGCKMLIDLVDTIKGPVYAVANPDEPTAGYLLAKLGWKPTGMFGPCGEVLVRG